MDLSRDVTLSSLSVNSEASNVLTSPPCGSNMEVLHTLYKTLEPQITKSYRPHVHYVPQEQSSKAEDNLTPRDKKIKTASIVIGAVAELKKRKDAAAKKKQVIEAAQNDSQAAGKALGKVKDVSQSLPNLNNEADDT